MTESKCECVCKNIEDSYPNLNPKEPRQPLRVSLWFFLLFYSTLLNKDRVLP